MLKSARRRPPINRGTQNFAGRHLIADQLKRIQELEGPRSVTLPILCHKGGNIALQFGVRCLIPEFLQTLRLKSGNDLPSPVWGGSWMLPFQDHRSKQVHRLFGSRRADCQRMG